MNSEITINSTNSEVLLSSLLSKLFKNIDELPIPNENSDKPYKYRTSLNEEVSEESKMIIILILKMITNLCNNFLDLIYKSTNDYYDGFYYKYKKTVNKLTIDSCPKSKDIFIFYKTACMRSLYNEKGFDFKGINNQSNYHKGKYELKIYICSWLNYFANASHKTKMANIINNYDKELKRLNEEFKSSSSKYTLEPAVSLEPALSPRKDVSPIKEKRTLKPLPPPLTEKSSTGGKTIKIKKTNKTKQLFGKERCIYKKSGDQKEYIKYKGDLITVKKYKIIIKNKKV